MEYLAHVLLLICVYWALASSLDLFVDPSSFDLMESVFIISIVIVGGAGHRWGPLVGAVALVVLPELLRFTTLPVGVAANLRQVFYGVLLVVFMIRRPRGLVGSRRPRPAGQES